MTLSTTQSLMQNALLALVLSATVLSIGCVNRPSRVEALLKHPEFRTAAQYAPEFTTAALKAIVDAERKR
ncbi:MAG: hypothetical protein RL328_768 [Acidobacteriota bacterium]|jgi:PBP1b-binding outer membrane lipoprotein LpoB